MSQTVPALIPATLDHESTLVLAIEVSNKSWVLAAQVPGLPHTKAKRTIDPEAEAFLAAIAAYRARAAAAGRQRATGQRGPIGSGWRLPVRAGARSANLNDGRPRQWPAHRPRPARCLHGGALAKCASCGLYDAAASATSSCLRKTKFLTSNICRRPAIENVTFGPCPKCGQSLRLGLIEPDESDHEKRTYQCNSCGYSEIKTVKYR